MSVGVFNTADNFSSLSGTTKASSSPYNVNVNNTNSGYQGPGNSYLGTPAAIESNEINNSGQDQTGPDSFGDVTVINTAVAFNATFAADNIFTGVGSIGLYGRSRGLGTEANNPGNPVSPPNEPNDWSIGVLGQSSKGCGMYGLATDDNPTTTPDQPSHGIGVVGRSIGGEALEDTSVEQVMGWTAPTFPAVANDGAIGVLGQSLNGPGVRGHGGPLQRLTPETTMTIATPMQANPGGIFSSGRRQYIEISGTPSLHQEVSPDSFPQLRLVPSFDPKLPEAGKIGDLFLQVQDPGIAATAQLWICTGYITDQGPDIQPKTLWRPVLMGNPLPGGTKAPPPVAFPPT